MLEPCSESSRNLLNVQETTWKKGGLTVGTVWTIPGKVRGQAVPGCLAGRQEGRTLGARCSIGCTCTACPDLTHTAVNHTSTPPSQQRVFSQWSGPLLENTPATRPATDVPTRVWARHKAPATKRQHVFNKFLMLVLVTHSWGSPLVGPRNPRRSTTLPDMLYVMTEVRMCWTQDAEPVGPNRPQTDE